MTLTTEETIAVPEEVVEALAPGITPGAAAHLRRAVEAMRAHPNRVSMGCWWEKTKCGTVGCIAGWMLDLLPPAEYERRMTVSEGIYLDAGAKLLGIPTRVAYRLFYEDDWPAHLRDRLAATKPRTIDHVEVIAQRVEYFIRKGK